MRAAAEAARREAQRLGRILTDEFGVERVYLFGSFAWGLETRPDSDLDLAVEGLPRGKLVFAHARLSNASRYTVDLVSLERLPELLRKRILKSGLVVYENQPEHVAG
ncbi:MAG: nucleotidyltransferase domain-containing protein [Chloroflexi bacterium]|nr:nucleotidyltransferase domain-containing protein [Chloroflexota bacterium]